MRNRWIVPRLSLAWLLLGSFGWQSCSCDPEVSPPNGDAASSGNDGAGNGGPDGSSPSDGSMPGADGQVTSADAQGGADALPPGADALPFGADAAPPDAARPLGGIGASCANATDCQATLICRAPGNTCAAGGGACTAHVQCGAGGVCGPQGCAQNVPGGPCDTNTQCVSGEVCAGDHCVPAGCGNSFYTAERVPPNLLLVVDRSGSMDSDIGSGASRDTKWNIARAAVSNLLTTYVGQIRFGLSLFPGLDQACDQGQRCGPGAINVAIAANREPAIASFINDANTCSFGTPIAEELRAVQGYAGLKDTTRPNYILLLTDGMATCDDPVPEVDALRRANPPVKTFVVGFGADVDPTQLRDMARAGGTARSTQPEYYQADDAASLRSAFAAIAGNVLSCTYTLGQRPPDPSLLYVYFDGTLVRRDTTHANGWDYASANNQVTFYGTACNQLRSGQVGQLLIVYGCPLPQSYDGGTGGSDGSTRDAAGTLDAGSGGTDGPTGDVGSSGGDGSTRDTGPDGGTDPGGNGCTSCTQCGGSLGCVIPAGQTSGTCGPCRNDFDCCLGFICTQGQCVPSF